MRNRGGPSGRALARAATAASEAPNGWPTWAALIPVGARYSPNTWRSAPAHSPVVPPAWAKAMVAAMTLVVPSAGAPRFDIGDHLGLDLWIDAQDRVGATERRCGGLGEAVHSDHHLLTRFDSAGAVGQGAHEARF